MQYHNQRDAWIDWDWLQEEGLAEQETLVRPR